jgi:hypothetical protein
LKHWNRKFSKQKKKGKGRENSRIKIKQQKLYMVWYSYIAPSLLVLIKAFLENTFHWLENEATAAIMQTNLPHVKIMDII